MIKLIILLPLIFLVVSPLSQVMAKTQELVPREQLQSIGFTEYESINPNSLIYQLKRLGENVRLLFVLDDTSKKKYYTHLFEIRFIELIYIINFQKTGFLAETVNRYNVFIGKAKPYYKHFDPNSINKINKYIDILEKLRDMYPANSSYWLSIQQAIDSTRNLL